MTLDEAIIHCREKACGDCACADDHRQLAEWLEELHSYKRLGAVSKARVLGYIADVQLSVSPNGNDNIIKRDMDKRTYTVLQWIYNGIKDMNYDVAAKQSCEDCENWIPGFEIKDEFIYPRCSLRPGVWHYDDYCSDFNRGNQND